MSVKTIESHNFFEYKIYSFFVEIVLVTNLFTKLKRQLLSLNILGRYYVAYVLILCAALISNLKIYSAHKYVGT